MVQSPQHDCHEAANRIEELQRAHAHALRYQSDLERQLAAMTSKRNETAFEAAKQLADSAERHKHTEINACQLASKVNKAEKQLAAARAEIERFDAVPAVIRAWLYCGGALPDKWGDLQDALEILGKSLAAPVQEPKP